LWRRPRPKLGCRAKERRRRRRRRRRRSVTVSFSRWTLLHGVDRCVNLKSDDQ
jgi:hypothetical protein